MGVWLKEGKEPGAVPGRGSLKGVFFHNPAYKFSK